MWINFVDDMRIIPLTVRNVVSFGLTVLRSRVSQHHPCVSFTRVRCSPMLVTGFDRDIAALPRQRIPHGHGASAAISPG